MIGIDLDDAVAKVQEALDYQGKQRGIDPRHLRSAIELWESLRPEAVADAEPEGESEIYPTQLTEEAQVAIHDRSTRIGDSITAFFGGWFSDKDQITEDDREEFAAAFRMFACAKVGTEMGIAMVKAIRIDASDVGRGLTRIDPKRFNVSLFEGSVIAEEEFTPEEERCRRARWALRHILATQYDRTLYKDSSLLADDELEYIDRLVELVNDDTPPDEPDMAVIDYLFAKVQKNNRLFGTTAGREELWIGQVREILAFLREFPTLDVGKLQEAELRMTEDVRATVAHLFEDPTLAGTIHEVADGKCKRCDMAASETEHRMICNEAARDELDKLLPLGALPDLYLVKAHLVAPDSGQESAE